MTQFEVGDFANMARHDGSEVVVRIDGVGMNHGQYIISELDRDGTLAGAPRTVRGEQLLRLRAPFFEIRGLVFTTSTLHPGEQGEIVALGHTANNQMSYRVKFADGSSEWFSGNDVVIQDRPHSSMDAGFGKGI